MTSIVNELTREAGSFAPLGATATALAAIAFVALICLLVEREVLRAMEGARSSERRRRALSVTALPLGFSVFLVMALRLTRLIT